MENPFESFLSWIKANFQEWMDKMLELRLMELEAGVLTVSEVAEKLGMSAETFRAYQHEYEALGFPKELPGKKWQKLAVLRWLAGETNK